MNPVRARMVSHPRHWAWNSYRATVGEAYRLVELAAHLGVHSATISRWLRRAEQNHV